MRDPVGRQSRSVWSYARLPVFSVQLLPNAYISQEEEKGNETFEFNIEKAFSPKSPVRQIANSRNLLRSEDRHKWPHGCCGWQPHHRYETA